MNPFGYYRKLRRNIDDYGLSTAFRKSLMYFVVLIYERRTYRLYVMDIDSYEGNTPVQSAGESFVFSALQPDEFDAIAQVEAMAEWLEGNLHDRIQSGNICLVAREGERVAGFNLISFGECYIPLIRKSHRFKPHQAWSEHIAIHKDFRRRGLGTGLRQQVFVKLKEVGAKQLYGGTLINNFPALKLARKLGFREFVDVEYRKFGVWRRWNYLRVRHETH